MNVDLDLKGGLRAMSLLKRNPGPLEPGELNQAVKHELAANVHCLCELADSGVLSKPLVREVEQIVLDKEQDRADRNPMRQPGVTLMEDWSDMDGDVDWDTGGGRSDDVSGLLGRHMEMRPVTTK